MNISKTIEKMAYTKFIKHRDMLDMYVTTDNEKDKKMASKNLAKENSYLFGGTYK